VSRIVLTVMVSLDGIFDGTGEAGERIDWMRADEEWLDYSVQLLDSHAVGPVADRMNDLAKVGFSRSPHTTTWRHARVGTDAVADITALRADDDPGLVLIMGSADLASSLTDHGLIDEYRLAINPVVLGAGVPLFRAGTSRLQFDLAETRNFASGIVELRLTPQLAPPRPTEQP
jgi:dihydrofolate reductase